MLYVQNRLLRYYIWIDPYISSDSDGDITVKWNNKSKELHLLFTEDEVIYIRVWGDDVNTEMDEGILDKNLYKNIWKWIVNE